MYVTLVVPKHALSYNYERCLRLEVRNVRQHSLDGSAVFLKGHVQASPLKSGDPSRVSPSFLSSARFLNSS